MMFRCKWGAEAKRFLRPMFIRALSCHIEIYQRKNEGGKRCVFSLLLLGRLYIHSITKFHPSSIFFFFRKLFLYISLPTSLKRTSSHDRSHFVIYLSHSREILRSSLRLSHGDERHQGEKAILPKHSSSTSSSFCQKAFLETSAHYMNMAVITAFRRCNLYRLYSNPRCEDRYDSGHVYRWGTHTSLIDFDKTRLQYISLYFSRLI